MPLLLVVLMAGLSFPVSRAQGQAESLLFDYSFKGTPYPGAIVQFVIDFTNAGQVVLGLDGYEVTTDFVYDFAILEQWGYPHNLYAGEKYSSSQSIEIPASTSLGSHPFKLRLLCEVSGKARNQTVNDFIQVQVNPAIPLLSNLGIIGGLSLLAASIAYFPLRSRRGFLIFKVLLGIWGGVLSTLAIGFALGVYFATDFHPMLLLEIGILIWAGVAPFLAEKSVWLTSRVNPYYGSGEFVGSLLRERSIREHRSLVIPCVAGIVFTLALLFPL